MLIYSRAEGAIMIVRSALFLGIQLLPCISFLLSIRNTKAQTILFRTLSHYHQVPEALAHVGPLNPFETAICSPHLKYKLSLVLTQPISPPIIYSQRHANHEDHKHESSINPVATSKPTLSLSSRVYPCPYDQARTTAESEVEGDGKACGRGRMSV